MGLQPFLQTHAPETLENILAVGTKKNYFSQIHLSDIQPISDPQLDKAAVTPLPISAEWREQVCLKAQQHPWTRLTNGK